MTSRLPTDYRPFVLVVIVALACVAGPGAGAARGQQPRFSQPSTAVPPKLDDVGIDQYPGAQIPLDLQFRDEAGRTVRLGEYFERTTPSGAKRPVILTLVYYECPKLCTLVLNDLSRAMNTLSLTAGRDFDVVSVSFDPKEGPELAARKKQQYLREYRRPEAETGWHFLTGPQESIDALTRAVGFRFAWDEKFKQFAHASGLMVLTPDGRLARYFYGIGYSAKDLRLALLEASGGRIGGLADQVLLYCFHYDPTTGKYSWAVLQVLKVAAGLSVVGLAGLVFGLSRRGRPTAAPAGATGPDDAARGAG